MYSAGVRAQYEMTAGNFAFIPSVGLRFSRLETDGFNAGTVRVDDQPNVGADADRASCDGS